MARETFRRLHGLVNTAVTIFPYGVAECRKPWCATYRMDRQASTGSPKVVDDICIRISELPATDGKTTQKTEDIIGGYACMIFLYYFVRFGFSPEKILFLAENAFEGTYSKESIKVLAVFLRRFCKPI